MAVKNTEKTKAHSDKSREENSLESPAKENVAQPKEKTFEQKKAEFAKLSPLNLYFSTIDAGFTTLYEPVENPDLGHYDALSELELGRIFGRLIIESYEMRN